MSKYTLVIHGGAGTIRKSTMTGEQEKAYRSGLQDAIDAGHAILSKGGRAIDAVVASCVSLEDNILFNAGKGSVFAHDGTQEMDASIMDGSNRMAGAVSAVRNVRNPILLAEKIMNESNHVMMSGAGAFDFARLHGLKIEPDEYFYSEFRHDQLKKIRETDETALDHGLSVKGGFSENQAIISEKKFGTVGACALDIHGNIAAATSTGGMTNKKYGRVGDSPIIGAGTYANNNTCAISCTGHGEPFIRAIAAYDVSCLMEYKGLSLEEAMRIVVFEKLLEIDGEGGMIGVDRSGNASLLFNSEGMYRGLRDHTGRNEIAIFN